MPCCANSETKAFDFLCMGSLTSLQSHQGNSILEMFEVCLLTISLGKVNMLITGPD